MRQPTVQDSYRDDGSVIRNPVLHDAETDDLEVAAHALRERTMTLEKDELLPSKRLLVVLFGCAATLAVSAVVFRSQLKTMLGLL